MDLATATWLVSDQAGDVLAEAESWADPGSLASATRLRRSLPPERAAAIAEQAVLRRRARAKAGEDAARLWWTSVGLEQATRPRVAARRAELFVARGARSIVDAGCGLGLDARAFAQAGLTVTGIERDPVTAVFAAANLAAWPDAQVVTGDVVDLLAEPGKNAVFLDPARRTAAGRSWRIEDLTPPWTFVRDLLDGSRLACAKLGPGLPHALIPDQVQAEWVSDAGALVEVALWAGPGSTPGQRTAVVDGQELADEPGLVEPPPAEIGAFVYEPDPAVIRAGLVGVVAEQLGATRIAAGIAYLSGPSLVATPWAQAFAVREILPVKEKALRAWVRENGIGVLEIKTRGLDLDPAQLRTKLRPAGPNAATLILTPTPRAALALVVSRVPTNAAPPKADPTNPAR